MHHNEVMHITSRHEFAADPATVHAMMTSEDFLQGLATKLGAERSNVESTPERTNLHAEVSAPSQVQKFTGSTLAMDLRNTWHKQSDDSYAGDMVIEIAKMPAKAGGNVTIKPGGKGSIVDYRADFSINIPLVGKRLEATAAPYVQKALDLQQQVGNEYLASH